MAISSVGVATSPNIYSLNSLSTSETSNVAGTTTPTSTDPKGTKTSAAGNNSNLSLAIRETLAKLNAGAGLSSLLTPDAQQTTSDFMSNLYSSLPGLSSSGSSPADPLSALLGNSSDQQSATPLQLDQSSPTIQLQMSIQKLIQQLDGNNNTGSLFGTSTAPNASSGLQNLQGSFNSLITASGGNPSQTSLQSFLKTVAANIQSSVSVGSLFDASA